MSEQLTAEQRVRAIFNRPEINVWQLRLEVLLVNAVEQAEQAAAQQQMERDAAAVCAVCRASKKSGWRPAQENEGVWRHYKKLHNQYTICDGGPIRAAFAAAHSGEGRSDERHV